jgi:hypothetical protein
LQKFSFWQKDFAKTFEKTKKAHEKFCGNENVSENFGNTNIFREIFHENEKCLQKLS